MDSKLTLDEMENLLNDAPIPGEVVGTSADHHKLQMACHPDRNRGEEERAARMLNKVEELHELHNNPNPPLKSPKREYQLYQLYAVGDVADIRVATSGRSKYLIKISRFPGGDKLLDHERKTVAELLLQAGDDHYSYYLPTLVESFAVKDPKNPKLQMRANVYSYGSGFYNLEQIHTKHPKLEGRHLAWIFKRLLTALGFAHNHGIVHGAVLPCHVLLHPAGHGLKLIGWLHSVPEQEPVKTISNRYKDWYPIEVQARKPASSETDLYMAAECLNYLGGGDRLVMPDGVPKLFDRYMDACLLAKQSSRPGNAWSLYDEFSEEIRSIYGPPKFQTLTM